MITNDQLPWIDIAEHILEGKFLRADSSTVESLTIGLRGVDCDLCRLAIAKLPDNKEKPKKK